MAEGWFTGKQLGDFFSETEDNPYDARTIINGHDCAQEIVGFYDDFLAALELSLIDEEDDEPAEPGPFVSTLKMGGHEVVLHFSDIVEIWVDGEPWEEAEA